MKYFSSLLLLLLLTASLAQGQTPGTAQAAPQGPSTASDYFFRGLARLSDGDTEGAVADFSKSIELDEAALAVNDSGRLRAALAETYCERGEVRMKDGRDPARSLPDFDRAIVLNPRYVRAYQHRAEVRRLVNDQEGAQSDLDKARSLSRETAKSRNGQSPPASAEAVASEDDELLEQNQPIPPNSKIYIEEWHGFEKYLQEAIRKKNVPLVIVADRASADFELRGGYSGGRGHWTVEGDRIPVPVKVHDDVSGQLSVINLRTNRRAWATTAEVEGGGLWATSGQSSHFSSPQKRLAEKLVKALKEKVITSTPQPAPGSQ
jgi:tetratricopeptide (TPR) repeat protein